MFSQQQWEKSTAYNEREGAYSFKDAYGRIRIVRYVADKHGFRPTIQSNEPGLAHTPPAHIVFANIHSASPPQYAPVSYSVAPSVVSYPVAKVPVHVNYQPQPAPVNYRPQPAPVSHQSQPAPVSYQPQPAPVNYRHQPALVKASKQADPLHLQYSAPISSSVIISPPSIPSNYQVITGKPAYLSPPALPHFPHQQSTVLLLPTVSSYKPKGKIVPKLVHPVQLLQVAKPRMKKPIRTISFVKPIELISFTKPVGTSFQYRWQQTKNRPARPIYASAAPLLNEAYEQLPHSLAYH